MAPRECRDCPAGKICNPASGRCVLATGAIGKLLKTAKPNVAKPNVKKSAGKCATDANCPAGKICNPASGRCVLATGAIGKLLKIAKPKPNVKKSAGKCATDADCGAARVCNPATSRCVFRTGAVGRRVLLHGRVQKPTGLRTVITRTDTKLLWAWVTKFLKPEIPDDSTWNRTKWGGVLPDAGPWASVYFSYYASLIPGAVRKPVPKRDMVATFETDRRVGKAPNVVVTGAILGKIVNNMAVKRIGAKKWQAVVDAEGGVPAPPKHQVAASSLSKQTKRLARAGSPDPESKASLKCKDLVTVPQSPNRGTCWFNAILMVFFFSDGMRRETKRALAEIARAMKTIPMYDVLQRLASLLLIYKQPHGSRNAIYNKAFQHGIRPEDILRSIHALDPKALQSRILPSLAPADVVKGKEGYLPYEFLPYIARLLEMDMVAYFAESWKKRGRHLQLREYWSQIRNETRPDVRVIIILRNDILRKWETWATQARDTRRTVGLDTNPVITVTAPTFNPETITIYGTTYVRDATLLESQPIPHAIAGVTCNGSRMYYNGWLSGDDASQPCPLIDVDWAKRGIYLASSRGSETRTQDYCYTERRMANTDLSFNGASPDQEQIMFYVKQ